MGILNLTPDSFSDGGWYPTVQLAVDAAKEMIDEGAVIIDVGGESSRPGSVPVSTEEELRRIVPVLEQLTGLGMEVSIDTRKAAVARAAIALGVSMVNDISAMKDPEMAEVCALADCEVCLMHMQGDSETMQVQPRYTNVVQEVSVFLLQQAKLAEKFGVKPENIWIDPGIGFGKTDVHNLTLIREIAKLASFDYRVVLGISRKGFLGRILGGNLCPAAVHERVYAGLGIHAYAVLNGVSMIRTHDVRETAELIKSLLAITFS